MQLLVIEDDSTIGKALNKGFTEAKHQCTLVRTGDLGLKQALSQQYDAIVLDLMLPGKSGLEVLTELRAQGARTPVVILTASGSVEERVAGLNAGADDYLVKPFAFPELMARLEAVRRRVSDRPTPVIQVGDLKLDLATRRVSLGQRDIDLTPTEYSLLELLMRYAGQVVTRKMLCEHVWDFDWEGTTNVIEVHVNRLRNKLERGQPENDVRDSLIHTIRGRGYALRAS